MKRKNLYALTVCFLAGVLITACQQPASGGDSGGAVPADTGDDEAQELNVYNWSTYIAPEIIPAFEEKFNVKVNYEQFGDNDELLAKIQPGNPGYDIIVPSDYMVEIMINEGLLEELDKSKVPNFGNIDDIFLDPPFDPGNGHCVPYQWGTVGLGYNSEAVPEPIDSWAVMYDGSNAGRISWLTETRMALGATLIYLGYDPNTTNPDEITEAKQLLIDTKDDVVAYAPDNGQQLLEQGEVDIAFEYSGDIFQLMADNPAIKYVIPKEGTLIWTDNMCIPAGAPHPDLAHEFINFILDAQIGSQLSEYTQYGTPNKASLPLLSEEVRNNPGIYPSEELRNSLYFIRSLGEADLLYEEAWTEIGVEQ
jgi:spermidine/putrescine transport system substrate-binding protein